MGAEKLSISLDAELASLIRTDAGEQGVSISTWIAEAAQTQVRQRRLGEALAAAAAEFGVMDPAEIDVLVAESRRGSIVTTGGAGPG